MADNKSVPKPSEEQFQEIFFEYHRPVVSFFQRGGASHEESLDLAQETFLLVFRGLESFRGDASIGTWIYTIAANVRMKALRSRSTAKRRAIEEHLLVDSEDDSPADFVSQERSTLQGMLEEERSRVLREALLELPPQMRRCVQLRVEHDLKYKEIAELLRVSIETVKSQIFAAKKVLKGRLADYFADEETGE